MPDLKETMGKYLSHIDLNRRFMEDLTKYYFKLFTKDENTMSFFGEGLWGVYPISFTLTDSNEWFDEIIQVDDTNLRHRIKELYADNVNIDVKWQRANDVVNLTLIYLVHIFLTSRLNDRDKVKGASYCLNILQYKFISSLQNHKFKYGVDKAIAIATYAQLTRKVMIKCFGSWKELFDKRALDIIDPRGIHYKVLMSYRDDYEVIKLVQEIQNRMRKMANFLTDEFYKVREQGKGIESSSKIISSEEGDRISDSIQKFNVYKNYLHSIIIDRNSLIKEDLLDIIAKTTRRIPSNTIKESLEWISDNSYSDLKEKINTWLTSTLEYSFKIIRETGLKTNQISQIIHKLRTMFLSSRTSNEKLTEAKESGLELIMMSDITNSKSSQITLRSSLMIYMVLRTLAMNHYG